MTKQQFEQQNGITDINRNWFNQITEKEYEEKSSKSTTSGKVTKVWQDVIKRFFRNKWNVIFLTIMIALIIVILVGSTFSRFNAVDPVSSSPTDKIRYMSPNDGNTLLNGVQMADIKNIFPTAHLSADGTSVVDASHNIVSSHWTGKAWSIQYVNTNFVSTLFGTDEVGRSVWQRAIASTKFSLGLALIVSVVTTGIGSIVGLYLGYNAGKKIDTYFMRLVEIISSIPSMLLVIIFVLIFGTGFWAFFISLILIYWIVPVSMARMFTLKIKDSEYIQASITLGASSHRIIFRHILPRIFGKLLVIFVQRIPRIIMAEATIVFLGIHLGGVDKNTLGNMLNTARTIAAMTGNFYYLLVPASLLLIFTISLQIIANGIRDAFDTKVYQ